MGPDQAAPRLSDEALASTLPDMSSWLRSHLAAASTRTRPQSGGGPELVVEDTANLADREPLLAAERPITRDAHATTATQYARRSSAIATP